MVIVSTSRRGGRGTGRSAGRGAGRGGRVQQQQQQQQQQQHTTQTQNNTRNDTEVDRLRKENEALKAQLDALIKEKNELHITVQELSKNTKNINIKVSNADDLLRAGLVYAGFDDERQKVRKQQNIDRFKAFYQLPPLTLFKYFSDVIKKFDGRVSYKDLLMTYNWFATYARLEVLAGIWGFCEKHIGKRTQECAEMMQSLKDEKIKFVFDDDGRIILCGLDFVNFTTTENRLQPHCKW